MNKSAYRDNPQANHPMLAAPVTLVREITSHHINSFNREHLVILADEPSNGGASHIYQLRLCPATMVGEESIINPKIDAPVDTIKFQMGPVQEVGFNGLTDEALLAIVLDRLRGFQRGTCGCRENAIVVTKLEESIMWLRARAEDRERRGVEGTSQK